MSRNYNHPTTPLPHSNRHSNRPTRHNVIQNQPSSNLVNVVPYHVPSGYCYNVPYGPIPFRNTQNTVFQMSTVNRFSTIGSSLLTNTGESPNYSNESGQFPHAPLMQHATLQPSIPQASMPSVESWPRARNPLDIIHPRCNHKFTYEELTTDSSITADEIVNSKYQDSIPQVNQGDENKSRNRDVTGAISPSNIASKENSPDEVSTKSVMTSVTEEAELVKVRKIDGANKPHEDTMDDKQQNDDNEKFVVILSDKENRNNDSTDGKICSNPELDKIGSKIEDMTREEECDVIKEEKAINVIKKIEGMEATIDTMTTGQSSNRAAITNIESCNTNAKNSQTTKQDKSDVVTKVESAESIVSVIGDKEKFFISDEMTVPQSIIKKENVSTNENISNEECKTEDKDNVKKKSELSDSKQDSHIDSEDNVDNAAMTQQSPVLLENLGENEGTLDNGEENKTGSKTSTKGKLEYEIEFLKSRSNHPLCLQKPDLPSLDIVLDSPINHMQPRGSDFLPNWLRQNPARVITGRGSQGRSQLRKEPVKIIAVPSMSQDVRLHTTDKAWKPALNSSNVNKDQNDEAVTEELTKKFRGILNKLTPQKYDRLLKQIDQLVVDLSKDRLNRILQLIFDKAVDEPAFCSQYSNLCEHLSEICKAEGNLFRNMLLNKCKKEFMHDMYKNINIEERIKEIEDETDPEKVKLLEVELDEDKRKARKRQLGIIKFVGQLYMLGMLNEKVMMSCLKHLNENMKMPEDEAVECICTLMVSIGYKIEKRLREPPELDKTGEGEESEQSKEENLQKKAEHKSIALQELDHLFTHLKNCVQDKRTCSRVRFMIQDVLDMRANGWKERKIQEDNKPKTIDQIQSDQQKEEERNLKEQKMAYAQTNRKGWSNTRKMAETLRNLNVVKPTDLSFGPSHAGTWGKGAQGGQQQARVSSEIGRHSLHNDSRRTTDNYDSVKGRGNSQIASGLQGNTAFSSSKDFPSYGGRTSSGGRTSAPFNSDAKKESSRSNSVEKKSAQSSALGRHSPKKEDVQAKKEISDETIQSKGKKMIEAFLCNFDEEDALISLECLLKEYDDKGIHLYLKTVIEYLLENSSPKNNITAGKLLCGFILRKYISEEKLYESLKIMVSSADNLVLDIPRLWESLAIILAQFFLGLNDSTRKTLFLQKLPGFWSSVKGKSLEAFMKDLILSACDSSSKEEVWRKWQSSNLKWSVFLSSATNEKEFIEKYGLEFTIRTQQSSNYSDNPSGTDLCQRLNALEDFILNNEVEDCINYIAHHFSSEEASTPLFASAFYKAFVKKCIRSEGPTLEDGPLFRCLGQFGSKFTQGEKSHEIKTLNALAELMSEMNHPKDMFVVLSQVFYKSKVISREGFKEWYTDKSSNVKGRGVVVNEMKRFISWLENEASDSDDTEDNDS